MDSHADLDKALHRIPWFLDLSQPQFDRLAGISSFLELEPGDYLLKEGDREDFLFILLEGQVVMEIEVPSRGQVPFFTAETLDVIGWSSLTPIIRYRTASARVTQPSRFLSIQSKLLEQLCEEDHELGYIVMRRIANVVASRMLTTRLSLMEIIAQGPEKSATVNRQTLSKSHS